MYAWMKQYWDFGRGGWDENEATSCLGLQDEQRALLCG
jgi:hypothetical protein